MKSELEARLKEVASRLGKSYQGWKSNEKKKESARKEFLALATEAVAEGELAEEVVEVKAGDEDEADELVQRRYPTYTVEESRVHPALEGYYEVIVKEDPALKPYFFEHDGLKFQRQVTIGAPYLDDERLREEDPELWESITFLPYKDLIEDLLYNTGTHHREFEEEYEGKEPFWQRQWVKDSLVEHGLKRQVRNLEDLSPPTLARLQDYIFEGKPQVKLGPVTRAQSE